MIIRTGKPDAESPFCPQAFCRVYDRFYRPIFKYVIQRVSYPEVAEEVTQEIFLKAYRFRETYRSSHAVSTWLWTIARNTICDWKRKHGAIGMLESAGASCEEFPAQAPDAEASLISRGRRRELLRKIRGLSRLQRKVIRMRALHQLSYAEIADALGLSMDSVKCSIYRAKLALTAQ